MKTFDLPKDADEIENVLQALDEFIGRTSEPIELKRALAVRMWIEGIETKKIQDILGVSAAFISKWKVCFAMEGVEGLKLKYQGSKSFLNSDERREVIEWLQSKNYWMLEELEAYIEEKYGVQFKSRTSYYELFKEAGISWKKTQKKNPKKNEEEVEKRRQEIQSFLETNREAIEAEKLVVYMIDECHLLWGDICGYVWGKSNMRVEIPVVNERERQTYYGALNFYTREFIVQEYEKGNSENTVSFLKYLQSQHLNSRIVIIWDGASYHRSKEIQDFLAEVNSNLEPLAWKITCIRFAPNAPEQNPVEDVWLKVKNFLRKYWYLCNSFAIMKWLFCFFFCGEKFDFSKLNWYGNFQPKSE